MTDLNACRHPRNELINPTPPPVGLALFLTAKAKIGKMPNSFPIFIASNSQ